MNWNTLQQQWQHDASAVPAAPPVDELMRADEKLRSKVLRRDRIETLAAAVVMVVFVGYALLAAALSEWLLVIGHAGIATWAAWVPYRLRQSRRKGAAPAPDAPLREHLARSRDATLAQARLLERAWLWYVLPCVVGLFVVTLADSGPTPIALAYLALVALAGAAIAWCNRRVAHRKLLPHAEVLQRELDALTDG